MDGCWNPKGPTVCVGECLNGTVPTVSLMMLFYSFEATQACVSSEGMDFSCPVCAHSVDSLNCAAVAVMLTYWTNILGLTWKDSEHQHGIF